jgi:hypothetical protein
MMAGCAQDPSLVIQPTASATTLTTNQVMQIAKEAIAKNDTWAERATYKAIHGTNGWTVTVWRIEGYDQSGKPQYVAGGFRDIQIDEQGRVKDYVRGH